MANRYLKIGGSNLLDGTTLENAWESIAFGNANVGASNTLNIDDGTYETKDTEWASIPSGSVGTYTTIKAINPNQVIFKLKTGEVYPTRVIQLPLENHYIEFNGVIIDGDFRSGDCIHFGGPGDGTNATSHLRFDTVTFRNTGNSGNGVNGGNGVQTAASNNHEYIDCTFKDIYQYGVYNQNGPNSYLRCTFDRCRQNGITCHSNGLSYSGITIDSCLFINGCGQHPVHAGQAIIFYNSTHTNSKIINNIIWGNRRGINISGGSTGHTIANNLFYANTLEGMFWTGTGNTFKNNISLNNGTNTSGPSTGNTLSKNITTGSGTSYWIDPANGDFHLKAGEPTTSDIVEQADVVASVTLDYDGVTRPTSPLPDIGPLQRDAGSTDVPPINVIPNLTTALDTIVPFTDFNITQNGDLATCILYAETGSFD